MSCGNSVRWEGVICCPFATKQWTADFLTRLYKYLYTPLQYKLYPLLSCYEYLLYHLCKQ